MNVGVRQETGRGLASRPDLASLSPCTTRLMKPSLTNADECRFVNMASRTTRGKGGRMKAPTFPPLRGRRARGDGLTFQRSCGGFTVLCRKAAEATVMCSSEASVLPDVHGAVSFACTYRAIKRSGVVKCFSWNTAYACLRLITSKVRNTLVQRKRILSFLEANYISENPYSQLYLSLFFD